jgi:hypothetical protein
MAQIRLSTATELGASFAKLALREASDVASFAESVKGMKAHEDFKAFTVFRDEFKGAAVNAGYADADSLWSRTWRAAKAFGFLGEFPRAQSTEATKKAAQREAAKAETKKLTEGKTPAELLAESRKALDAGEADKAVAIMQAAKAAQAQADKAAKDKAHEATKAQVLRIRGVLERLVKSGDVGKLTKLANAAEKLSPVPAE